MKASETKDILDLIDIAEKASESAKNYNNKISKLYAIIYFSFFIIIAIVVSFNFYRGDWDVKYNLLFPFGISIISSLIFYSIYIMLQIFKLKKELTVEDNILAKLLDMTYQQIESKDFNKELTIVEKAIIDMRLSRISFSNSRYRYLRGSKSYS